MTWELALFLVVLFAAIAVHASYLSAVQALMDRVREGHPERWSELSIWQTFVEPTRGIFLWSGFWAGIADPGVIQRLLRARGRCLGAWAAFVLAMAIAALLGIGAAP